MAYVNKEKTGFFGRLFHSRRNNNPQSSEAEQTVVQLAAMPVLAEQIVTEDQTASTSAQPKNLKQIVPVSSNAARTWDELLEKILKDQSTAFGSQDVHSNTTGEAVEDYAEPDAPTTQFAPLDEIPADPGSQDYTPYADLGTAQDADLGTAPDADLGTAPDNDLSAAQEAFAAGDYEAALSGFEAAYLAGSETAQTGLLKALVALGDSTEKAEKALEYYERALSLAGPNQVLVSKLIQQCVNAGRFTDAKVYLEQAFMPESTEY
ncbi:MAG TPA: hypothetical protein VHQ46_03725, partial [Desulfobacteria bacterium]|nr:hypothetical protein [Desulfobacteria bacterium]